MKRARLFEENKRSRIELRALGRSLRERAPRRDHAPWQPGPVDILRSQEGDRINELIPIHSLYNRLCRVFTDSRARARRW